MAKKAPPSGASKTVVIGPDPKPGPGRPLGEDLGPIVLFVFAFVLPWAHLDLWEGDVPQRVETQLPLGGVLFIVSMFFLIFMWVALEDVVTKGPSDRQVGPGARTQGALRLGPRTGLAFVIAGGAIGASFPAYEAWLGAPGVGVPWMIASGSLGGLLGGALSVIHTGPWLDRALRQFGRILACYSYVILSCLLAALLVWAHRVVSPWKLVVLPFRVGTLLGGGLQSLVLLSPALAVWASEGRRRNREQQPLSGDPL